jgi:cytidylate kinase
MLPPTVKKQKIKLRKINQQEKEVIFKDYYDRKRELSPLKYSSKNLFGKMTATSTNLGMT